MWGLKDKTYLITSIFIILVVGGDEFNKGNREKFLTAINIQKKYIILFSVSYSVLVSLKK